MFRVSNALERYAPDDVTIVPDGGRADLCVHHVIGAEAITYKPTVPCAVMQYCVNSATPEGRAPWHPLWERAVQTWSYYDLSQSIAAEKFYHAPLGIDSIFRVPYIEQPRTVTVLTSGYVNGHGQEAIEEPTLAAKAVGGRPVHLGPIPEGLTQPIELELMKDIGDSVLAALYRRCKWVVGLRYVEGFELSVVEGLACGARPIVFDRPDNRHWFGDHVRYVPECSGDELTQRLAYIMRDEPPPVTPDERAEILERFNWKTIVNGFWTRVKEQA